MADPGPDDPHFKDFPRFFSKDFQDFFSKPPSPALWGAPATVPARRAIGRRPRPAARRLSRRPIATPRWPTRTRGDGAVAGAFYGHWAGRLPRPRPRAARIGPSAILAE